MEFRELGNTGLRVSALGLGTSHFGESPRYRREIFGFGRQLFGRADSTTDFKSCKRCLDTALGVGINFIDTSPYYGLTQSETMLGRTLIGVPRERYLLATKIGRYGNNPSDFDFSANRVTRSVNESLSRLGIEYVDIIQCHDVEFGDLNQIVEETIPALREVVKTGKARFIGVTGLPLKVFLNVLSRTQVDTILSYCHYSLNDTSLETLLTPLAEKNIGIISASPFSMGLLTQNGLPGWHPAPDAIKTACRRAVEHCHSKAISIEKLAIQFATSNPRIATTLMGTNSAAHIENNARWLEEPLDEELLREVEEILAPIKNQTWPSGRIENNH
ncbi:aldo/keto reductase [bacterium]|nr:MAG: aldo/keto reductase [bacterium]